MLLDPVNAININTITPRTQGFVNLIIALAGPTDVVSLAFIVSTLE
jgi:hypothetical protein